jgi:hypothetical protein
MSKIRSLQYLLLDALNKRDSKISKNIASTLIVQQNNLNYIVLWKENFEQKKIEVEKNQFVFYQRNDIENSMLDLSKSLSFNNNNANLLIDKILKEEKKINKSLNFFKKYLVQILIILITITIAVSFSNLQYKLIPILIISSLIFDLIEKKKIFFYLILFMITLLKPDKFILFYSFFLILFNFFEPIYFLKKIKLFTLIISLYLNFYFLDLSLSNIYIHLIIVVLLTIIITLVNFTKYNSNYNWLYCLPAFSFGFLLNNEIIISYLWILNCFLLPMIFNYLDKKIFLKIKTLPLP